jgi:putative addiction module CopG family antidote
LFYRTRGTQLSPDVMRPMEIDLTPELERFVRVKVQSGEYASSDEVTHHALRLIAREEQEYAAQLRASPASSTRPSPSTSTARSFRVRSPWRRQRPSSGT